VDARPPLCRVVADQGVDLAGEPALGDAATGRRACEPGPQDCLVTAPAGSEDALAGREEQGRPCAPRDEVDALVSPPAVRLEGQWQLAVGLRGGGLADY